MQKRYAVVLLTFFFMIESYSQEKYKFKLEVPVFDYSENLDLAFKYPSMNEAMEWSHDMYELGFWGIDELGDLIFGKGKKPYSALRRIGNNVFKYGSSLAFSKWGSELPVPLGVWGHEEFHRSVLGVSGLSPKNGNWLFSRWDGTVYGISDQELTGLKLESTDNLLYSYVAGVQYEVLLNERVTLDGVFKPKSFPRSALLLYNAWYVYDYFRFSAGSGSDSAKYLATPHENPDPSERDYAGSDLNAWVYDMFNPGRPYIQRDPFPGGNGVNRRIGFSELATDEQDFLKEQKKLLLLNFLNPSILFNNRIRINDGFSFTIFSQYMPTHFGNDIAIYLPIKLRVTGLLMNVHRFSSKDLTGIGFGLGLYDGWLSENISTDIRMNVWDQPESFLGEEKIAGASADVVLRYSFHDDFAGFVSVSGKTRGWLAGDPYLKENLSVRFGISYGLKK
jgi:hypothetical protein